MSDANKILTVSYGTFSCTLEGFDDPFGTMRGIAEYFRDLAAEDRYFGAEPPTPDVEMLQSIARANIAKRVEARISDGGVALRAAETVDDAELSEAPAAAPASKTTETEAKERDVPKAAPAPPKDEEVSPTAPLAFDDDYLMADEPEDAFHIDMDAPAVSDRPAESIAEKLRRIRAVVSRNIEPESSDPGPFDAADSGVRSAFDAQTPKRDRALTETIRSISADIAEEDHETLVGGANEAEEAEPDFAIGAHDEAHAADDADHGPIITEDDGEADEDERADDEFRRRSRELEILKAAAAERKQSSEDMIAGVMAATSRETEAKEYAPEAAEAGDEDERDLPQSMDEAEEGDVVQDAAEADAEGDAAVDETEDRDAEVTPSEDERDAGPVAETPETAGAARPEAHETPLEPLSETNGQVGRLLKETDEKFADGEGIRRRRVISQMRAAVAATKAERVFSKMTSPAEKAEAEQSPYRRDLDAAMPSPPPRTADALPEVANEETTPEPKAPEAKAPAAKTSPLVLVSSQRVDTAPPAPKVSVPEPARPQRQGADTFAAFAEKMGAEELPDLLEAAAAYSAFVEGQPHFSRPEIMKRVARIDPQLSLSREAGLRSFGMLLRQGKIRKLQRGQFAIAEDTRFNPAHRIAGE